jgi:DNA excision repair protein ERCC-3
LDEDRFLLQIEDKKGMGLIVQSDGSILLETSTAGYEEIRDFLSKFAEIEKSPEYVHTYRITPLSLWNAASLGFTERTITDGLRKFSRYPLPSNIEHSIGAHISKYGRLKLHRLNGKLMLQADDPYIIEDLIRRKEFDKYAARRIDSRSVDIEETERGHIKQDLFNMGYPVEDMGGYVEGEYLNVELRAVTKNGIPFELRAYQKESAEMFHSGGTVFGGNGVIVLPCGAGKTVVGLSVMEKIKRSTLILCPNNTGARQWVDEIIDKTDVPAYDIGLYTGGSKEIRPITISTYQIMTWRSDPDAPFPHFELFRRRNWGLIIYDEVHLLPAPVFSITANLQGVRRLGLTATLVREDGREKDVFTLIGPKRYDVPWRVLEKQGWISPVECNEYRVRFPTERERMTYIETPQRGRFGIAARNPAKLEVVNRLIQKHASDNIIVMGDYLDQMKRIADALSAPLVTGKTPERKREKIYRDFLEHRLNIFVASKVVNFALNLPDANVAIQVSGTFGSRQEEAQRIGRILRPKGAGKIAHFYTIVTRDTVEVDFAARRELFLTEQGYAYTVKDVDGEGLNAPAES